MQILDARHVETKSLQSNPHYCKVIFCHMPDFGCEATEPRSSSHRFGGLTPTATCCHRFAALGTERYEGALGSRFRGLNDKAIQELVN